MQTTLPARRLCLPIQLALLVGASIHGARAQGPNFDPNQQNQSDQPPPTYTTTHLDAVVVSSLDGKPVPRVLVTSADGRMAAMTDSEGRFSFDLRRADPQSPAQTYPSFPFSPAAAAATIPVRFNLRKPGFVTANNVTVHVAAVPPATPEPALQLKIVPSAVLTGHLSPEAGDLPANTGVMLKAKVVWGGVANWGYISAQVNSHGDFRFAHLPPGDFKLVVPASLPHNPPRQAASVPGFRTTFYPHATSFDEAAVIHIGPGESSFASMTYHNANFYHVTIPVTALPNDKGFYASLLPDMPGLAIVRTGDVAQGYLPSGTYDVQLRSAETITSQNQFPIVSVATVRLQIDSKAVQTNPVALHPGFEVPVEVHVEFGNTPLPQSDPQHPSPIVFVNLQSVDNVGMQPVAQNLPSGVTTIRNLYDGTFRVEISSAIAGYVASATSGTTDLLREPLRVIPGSAPRPIEVTLRDDAASISARLATAANYLPQATSDYPVYVICVPLDRPQAQAFNFNITRDDFSIPNLAPGRYLILATHQQMNQPSQAGSGGMDLEYRNEEAIPGLISKGVTVTLEPNQKADVEVPLMPEDSN